MTHGSNCGWSMEDDGSLETVLAFICCRDRGTRRHVLAPSRGSLVCESIEPLLHHSVAASVTRGSRAFAP